MSSFVAMVRQSARIRQANLPKAPETPDTPVLRRRHQIFTMQPYNLSWPVYGITKKLFEG
jgi:hypothetical protein